MLEYYVTMSIFVSECCCGLVLCNLHDFLYDLGFFWITCEWKEIGIPLSPGKVLTLYLDISCSTNIRAQRTTNAVTAGRMCVLHNYHKTSTGHFFIYKSLYLCFQTK